MKVVPSGAGGPTRLQVEEDPRGIDIDFSAFGELRFRAPNVERCTLRGRFTKAHHLNSANIVSSRLSSLVVVGTSWQDTDVKDCAIDQTTFQSANLAKTTWVGNMFTASSFVDCAFDLSLIANCTFLNCRFVTCNLVRLMMKHCYFEDCEFQVCETSNELIEYSVLRRTSFSHTLLQLETVLHNFGLARNYLYSGSHLTDRRRDAPLSPTDLETRARDASLTPLERLKLRYFLDSTLNTAGGTLDASLDLSSWLPLCTVPATFSLLLEGFVGFLKAEYDEAHLPLSPLLRLHTAVRGLVETLEQSEEYAEPSRASFIASLNAASLRLLPTFEWYLRILDALINRYDGELVFLVEGPQDLKYYETAFQAILPGVNVGAKQIQPANSPGLLTLVPLHEMTVATVLAAFLGSRIEVEIRKLQTELLVDATRARPQIAPGERKQAGEGSVPNGAELSNDQGRRLFDLSIGSRQAQAPLYEFRIFALFPKGLGVRLQLQIGFALVQRLRSILIDLLKPPSRTA